MVMQRLFLVVGCCLLAAISTPTSLLALPRATVDIEPRSGTLRDAFLMRVTVEGGEDSDSPRLSSNDFLIQDAGRQSSVSIINGAVQSRVTYAFRLTPRREGKLQSPSGTMTIGGETISLESKEVDVGAAPPPARDDSVMLHQSIDRDAAYVGEQVVASIELLSRVNLVNPRFEDLSFDGFWVEQFGQDSKSNRYRAGVFYNSFLTRRALFPQRAAPRLEIPPKRVTAAVLDPRQRRTPDLLHPFDPNFFDNFLGQSLYQDRTFDSEGVTLQVLPLPSPPPALPRWMPLNPLVGQTALRSEFGPGPYSVGQAIPLTIEVTSYGNLNALKDLHIVTPPAFKIYPTPGEYRRDESGDRLLAIRRFHFSMVPLGGGSFEIPPVEIGYFDPRTRSYRTATSEGIRFEIEGPPVTPSPTTPLPDVEPPSKPTHAIELYREYSLLEQITRSVTWQLVALLSLVCAGISLIVWRTVRHLRRRTSRLSLLDVEEANEIHHLRGAVRLFLSRRYHLPPQFSRAALRERINSNDLAFEVDLLLDSLESLESHSVQSFAELKTRALVVLRILRL